MATPRDQRLEELFEAAVDLTPDQRAAYLSSHCSDDLTLRQELDLLLMHDADRSEDFLRSPAVLLPTSVGLLEAGTDIAGRYTIVRLLGEGGMGLVYLADQTAPVKRRVAVKLVKLGMDTREVLARFESERQALAMLGHPNIATVFDAGVTSDGRPFFVMEYVDGELITSYCDANNLSIDARIDLVVCACEAIQHAHHNGIIHRDLKPSNLLVTEVDGRPELKVIDFGIAKALHSPLTERTLETVQGQFIGTPQYMSPEQARGSTAGIDTRADVYALGVLLYELLAGSTPFEQTTYHLASIEEIRRRICNDDPPRPSTRVSHLKPERAAAAAGHRGTTPTALTRALRGDLDWIVMRSIDKDRERRYESTAALAEELKRYQRHEPVLAGPPSMLYASRKFVRRHRPFVIGAVVVVLTMVVGVVATAIFAIGEAKANRRVQQQQRITLAVNEVLLDILSAPDPRNVESPADVPRDVTVREAIVSVEGTIDERFREDPAVAAAVHYALGETFLHLADYERAERHAGAALTIRRDHLGVENFDTLEAMHLMVRLHAQNGRYEDARVVAQEAYQVRRRLAAHDVNTLVALVDLADALMDCGDYQRSQAMYREAIRLHDDGTPMTDQNVIVVHNSLAVNLMRLGKYADAEPIIRESIRLMSELAGPDHSDTLDFRDNLAAVLVNQKRYADAEEVLLPLVEARTRMLGPSNRWTLNSRSMLANVYRRMKRLDDASEVFEAILPIAADTLGSDHTTTLTITNNYAVCCRDQGRLDEANAMFERVLAMRESQLEATHPLVLLGRGNIARVRVLQGRYDEAETLAMEAYEGFSATLGDGHPRTQIVMRILRDLYKAWPQPDLESAWQRRLDGLGASEPG